jgi:hypothetical protein
MTMILGMQITQCDETDGGPAYLLTSHCGAIYGLYRMPADVDRTVMTAKQEKAGRYPILNTRSDRFTDRSGILKLIGR